MSRVSQIAVETHTDWRIRPLGDVVKPTRPRVKPAERPELPFIGMEHVEAHTMKLLGTVPAARMKSSAVHFQPGDVLYGRLRPYLNKVYGPDFEGLCSAEFIVFPKTDEIESRYLQHFLSSAAFVAFASHLNAGDRPRVDFDQLAPFPFPVAPLDQQRRIVAEIEKQFSRLDEAVANLNRVKANLKRYKAAVLKAAVEGRLVETEAELARREGRTYEAGDQLLQRVLETRRSHFLGKRQYKEPATPNTADLHELPEGWVWASVEQLLRNDSSLSYGILKPGEYDADGVPMVRVMDIGDGEFNNTELFRVNKRLSDEFKRTELEQGDILLAVMATIGRCAIVPPALVGANVNRALAVIRTNALVDSRFVCLFIRAPEMQTRFQRNKIGSAQARINLAALREYAIALPPLAEQKRILAEVDRHLSLIREIETQEAVSARRAEALKQSLLTRAFSSPLVPHSRRATPVRNTSDLDAGQQPGTKVLTNTPAESVVTEFAVTKVIEALESSGAWANARDVFRRCGIADGADTDAIEKIYSELRDDVRRGVVEVERRGEEDWLRIARDTGA